MLHLLRGLFSGIASAFSFPVAPLYRYPYFRSGEAFRGDWLRIGEDVESVTSDGTDHE
jgi:hypothetical protein